MLAELYSHGPFHALNRPSPESLTKGEDHREFHLEEPF
jgi:hypothetical protein